MHRALGNAGASVAVQAKLAIGSPGDRYEQEADRVAEQVASGASASARLSDGGGTVRRSCAACAGGGAPCPQCEEEKVQRMPAASSITPMVQREADPAVPEEEVVQGKESPGTTPVMTSRQEGMVNSLRGGGEPLSSGVRSYMEPRFGYDFSGVRLHRDGRAAESARSIGALAYTIGEDVVFGAGMYSPDTAEGKRLLAHELTHVVQQGGSRARDVVQRQPAPAAEITAKTIFPFPVGSQVEMERIMNPIFFSQFGELKPREATGFNALDGQIAKITTATDDEVSGTVPTPVDVPSVGTNPRIGIEPARTLTGVTLRLRRRQEKEKDKDVTLFDLELLWKEPSEKEATVHFWRRGMTASRDGDAVILSEKGVPQLRSTVDDKGKNLVMEAFTAPFRDEIPAQFRAFTPDRIDLLSATKIADAPPATPDAKGAIEEGVEALPKRSSRRRDYRAQIMVGGGVQHGAQWDPVITSSWQISFMPAPSLGSLIQIPIELQVQYAPPDSVVGALSTGFEVSLAQLQYPVNIRLLNLGVGGGVIRGNEPDDGGARPQLPVLGPTLGLGGGLEIGAFRLDLRYDHLFNLWESAPDTLGPDLNTLSLRAGGVW